MITRRKFLYQISTSSVASWMGVRLFGNGKAHAEYSPPLILRLHCEGGWDPAMVFDPKMDSSFVAAESGISSASAHGLTFATSSSRPSVAEFFSNHGASSVIINGISCGAADHEQALQSCLGRRFRDDDNLYQDYLTYYAHATNPTTTAPHVSFAMRPAAGSRSAATSFLDDSILSEYASSPAGSDLGHAAETALTRFLDLSFGDTVETRPSFGLDADKISGLYQGYKREQVYRAQLSELHDGVTASGQATFVTHAKLALEMMASSLSQCATIRVGGPREWDSHRNHFTKQNTLFEALFSGLNEIITHATSKGIHNRLVMIVTSELGRHPQLNSQSGKDHWPYTSMLAWGSALKGGQVLGSTDDWLRGIPLNPANGETSTTTSGGSEPQSSSDDIIPLTMVNVMAGLFAALDQPIDLAFPAITPLLGVKNS